MTISLRTYWSLLVREFWENKVMVFWLPLIVVAIIVLQNILGLALLLGKGKTEQVVKIIDHSYQQSRLPGEQRTTAGEIGGMNFDISDESNFEFFLKLSDAQFAMSSGLHLVVIIFSVLSLVVTTIYLLSSLYSDRTDRSILFWKSLPFSETENVLMKFAFGILIIPLWILVLSIVAQLSGSITLAMIYSFSEHYTFFGMLGQINPLVELVRQVFVILVFAITTMSLSAWLMLASATSKRMPLLLAVAVPFVLGLVDYFLLSGEYLSAVWDYLFAIDWPLLEAAWKAEALTPHLDPVRILMGVVTTVVLLIAAIWCRNHRFEL